MRGLKKSVERRQTNKERNRHKDILTTRKNWTKGRFFEKNTVLNWPPSEKTKSRTCHPQKCPRMSQTLVILGVASSRLYHFLWVASPWLSHFRGWPFQNSVVFFYGFWHIGKFGGGKKDESPCTVVFGANTMVFRANTVYFVWKIQQYFGYSVFFCLFFNTVVFSGKYSGILSKKI